MAPTLTIGNKNGDYTVTGGALIAEVEDTWIFKYTNSISVEKKSCDDWLITLTVNITTTLSIQKRTPGDDLEIGTNNLLEKALSFYHEHQTATMNEAINLIRNNLNSLVDQMYSEAGFINTIA